MLKRNCRNTDVSGYGESGRALGNFEAVRKALCELKVFAWVYEIDSLPCLEKVGALRGRWRMGSEFGSCVGNLVWVKDVRHVVRFKDVSGHVPFIATNENAPWCTAQPAISAKIS